MGDRCPWSHSEVESICTLRLKKTIDEWGEVYWKQIMAAYEAELGYYEIKRRNCSGERMKGEQLCGKDLYQVVGPRALYNERGRVVTAEELNALEGKVCPNPLV